MDRVNKARLERGLAVFEEAGAADWGAGLWSNDRVPSFEEVLMEVLVVAQGYESDHVTKKYPGVSHQAAADAYLSGFHAARARSPR